MPPTAPKTISEISMPVEPNVLYLMGSCPLAFEWRCHVTKTHYRAESAAAAGWSHPFVRPRTLCLHSNPRGQQVVSVSRVHAAASRAGPTPGHGVADPGVRYNVRVSRPPNGSRGLPADIRAEGAGPPRQGPTLDDTAKYVSGIRGDKDPGWSARLRGACPPERRGLEFRYGISGPTLSLSSREEDTL